ncbi:ArnT family glycosyltransferase [Nocardia macrotermitis]|uniref:Glycosyltransferase RgtA/B/C/D-like domain-containing protein n=1 Tax=Nocardia macrotermitis TaxID=2585198 RepID=A0A7K0CUK0_9NOCA|nr:glycosyltransferase family 39 protein [Nocardia macrotermitis]MQY17118.1 hypothetical protein [Nocardia macrotermitis]
MTAISGRTGRGNQPVAEQDPNTPEVRFATLAVTAVALVTGIVLLVRSARYGYFGDELYFVAAGNHLAPSYVDQGPLIPLLARAAWTLVPGSVVALRIPSILAAIAGVLLAGAFARELGGRRLAQVLAALAYATCPYLITQAATLSTFALDSTLSATALWLLTRWIRLRHDRLLLAFAAVIALDLQIKLLITVLLAGILTGIALAGPRNLLRRSTLWCALPVVALTALPGILWQQHHHWPQLAMGAIIRTEQHSATGGPLGLPLQWALLTGLLGGLLALLGCWTLLRHNMFRAHRWIAITVIVEILFVILTGGRPYYVAGLFPALFAAGATALQNIRRRTTSTVVDNPDRATRFSGSVAAQYIPRRLARTAGIAVVVVPIAISLTVVFVLPLPLGRIDRPVRSQAELSTRMRTFGTTGWSHLVEGVDAAYRALPEDDRAGAVILTQTYWQAAALEDLSPPDHPAVFSADRGYAYFGRPPDTARTVLYVSAGGPKELPRNIFGVAEPVAHIDDPLGFPGIDRGVTVWRCRYPREPWVALWPHLTTLVLDPGL